MNYPDKKIVERLREQFPEGTRVELIQMNDSGAPPAGTRGTVKGVDDIGSILVVWDNGSTLSLAYGVDRCRILVGEFTQTVRDQILSVRDTGETNMFDIPAVQRIADRLGYYELVLFLIDHKKEYAHFIMTGEME